MVKVEKNEAVASLHRYYHNSVEMKYQFAEVWKGPLPIDPSVIWSEPQILRGVYGYMYMSLWLGFMHTVVEGWVKIDLKDSSIERLLDTHYPESLKIFRHTVFHFQKNYWAKMAEKHLALPGFLEWAINLDNEFERWFTNNAPVKNWSINSK